jgi:hypothetical protein
MPAPPDSEITKMKFLNVHGSGEPFPVREGVSARVTGGRLETTELHVVRNARFESDIQVLSGNSALGFITGSTLDLQGGNPAPFGPLEQGVCARFRSDVRVHGNVIVDGDIKLSSADCAEQFDIDSSADQAIKPGMVVVLGREGRLRLSHSGYDKRVVGVVSGAGSFRPAIVLDRKDDPSRIAVALMGKIECYVDASYGAIDVGDLLCSSDTPGHAMKASDPARAFGTVIGKALQALPQGSGLIPILVSLQ